MDRVWESLWGSVEVEEEIARCRRSQMVGERTEGAARK